MTLAFIVYFIGMLTPLKIALVASLIGLIIFGIFYSLYWMDELSNYEDQPYNKKWLKILIGIVAALVITPSERTAYTMAGAYAAQQIATHPNTAEVGSKVMGILNQKLDGYIKDTAEKKED
ncbi:MAG: hypothetical protein M0R77_07700 [Gammaproteobacteria bacterium]|nr:hypothetical protein [Gammaproteobacteria bacterium]